MNGRWHLPGHPRARARGGVGYEGPAISTRQLENRDHIRRCIESYPRPATERWPDWCIGAHSRW